jgi:transcriptional regulator with XRE-family HTH domain
MQKIIKYNVMITVHLEDAISLRWDKSLGVNLSNLRKTRNITRKGLAELTSISNGLLEKIETGLVPTVTKDNLTLIAITLGVNIAELYPLLEIKITEID